MTGRRVLVTGATGFIGQHVANALLAKGDSIVATGRNHATLEMLRQRGMSIQAVDLVRDNLESLMSGVDAVVHCAALSSPWGKRNDFFEANVVATRRLLAAAARAGVTRVVHLSSPSIYHRDADQFDIPEAFSPPQAWITPYAETKWLAEMEVRSACQAGPQAAILRPRAVFGPGDRAIFPRLLALARKGRFPLLNGGQAMIDVTYIDNMVQAVNRALESVLPSQVMTFNISNAEPTSVRTLLDLLFEATQLNVRYLRMQRGTALRIASVVERVASLLPGRPEPPVTRYKLGVLAWSQTLDVNQARAVLGYAPDVGVADGIQRFAAWWKQHDHH